MRIIPLTQGQIALVDDGDYKDLSLLRWRASKGRNTYYACRLAGQPRQGILMHRVILGLQLGDSRQVDHRNGNGLDNRRTNLRLCTPSQNQYNQPPHCGKRFKGCCYQSRERKFFAYIKVNGIRLYLGRFKTELEAAWAFNQAAIKHHGEFAYLNSFTSDELEILKAEVGE